MAWPYWGMPFGASCLKVCRIVYSSDCRCSLSQLCAFFGSMQAWGRMFECSA